MTFNYQPYDAVGNRTTITQQDGASPAGTNTYTYDTLNRETGATHPQPPTINPTESFTYDAVGNRLSSQRSDIYTYNAANRLTADRTFAYQYDTDGNLTSKCQGTACTTYTYDPENRLTQVALSSSTTISYKYDGLGRRIEKNEGGTITRYVYDNENILETFNGSNVLQQRFTHRLDVDQPISFDQGGQSYFYLADALGSIMKITDSSSTVQQSYLYDSFGNIVRQVGSINQPFTYTGREWDAAAGLYYYRARYYDPSIGRFINEDPIGFAGGTNFYTYVGNNPVNFTDPFGLCRKRGEGFWDCVARVADGVTGGLFSRVGITPIIAGGIGAGLRWIRIPYPGVGVIPSGWGLSAALTWLTATLANLGPRAILRVLGTLTRIITRASQIGIVLGVAEAAILIYAAIDCSRDCPCPNQ